jgi:hypothetical protein
LDCFSDAVCAAWAIRAGHNALSAEGFCGVCDSLIVCGDNDPVGKFGASGLFVNVLDEEFAGIFGENFTWESC